MVTKKLFVMLGVLMTACLSTSVVGAEMKTKDYELDNGLRIVVREDHRAPVVVAQVWYKVGSADEYTGVTGISHILEHLMFKGTEKYPGDSYSQIIARNGGHENAFTAEDYTGYYAEVAASKLDLVLELEADRMQNLQIKPEYFEKELEVVKEERRLRTEDNPQRMTFERFYAAANPAGPYHHPVVGWMHDIEQTTVEDLKAWYDNWYGPSNAVLVVVGAVKADEVYALAQKHFGEIEPRATRKSKTFKELEPLGETRLKVNLPAQLPFLLMGFHVPTSGTVSDENVGDIYALMVASEILDGGESARLAKNLDRAKEIAASYAAYYEPFQRYGSQFLFMGTPSQDHSVQALEEAFWEEIEQLKSTLVPQEELKRAKTKMVAEEIYDKDSMSNQALFIGVLESIGLSWQDADKYVDRIKDVSAEQVQAVAQKYFVKERAVIAELVPQPMHEEDA